MQQTITPEHLALLALLAAICPLVSFINIFIGKSGKGSGIAVAGIFISFLITVFLFGQVWNNAPVNYRLEWFSVGETVFTAGILLNNLSVLMLLLVTVIALLVHIYSVEYMHADMYLHRYWGYLGLFCFSMLGLVIANNLLLIYIFWELVGFSSYLLIGFWFTKDAASQAAKKAFIMNRIGDLGFLLGILIIYSQFKTLDIQQLFRDKGLVSLSAIENGMWINGVQQMPAVWFTIAGIAFFMGAVAKSAQFPLHTWLPDAMEGPTSVSSLIHAATMVAAGVFLLARINPVFNDLVLLMIAVTGAFTAFMAATIALAQHDIKKILAFSTISQLGFMMLAIGIGATGEGIFHLTAHAFFKCLLFLAAGAVIHQLHHLKKAHQLDFDNQDIRNMGGLRKQMPVTFYTMLIAAMAIIGIPLTSGYLSKDAIFIKSFEWADFKGGAAVVIPYVMLLSSWITTFYVSRMLFKVFYGKSFSEKLSITDTAVHDAPWKMNLPLIVLAVCCLFPLFSINPLLFEQAWLLKGFPILESLQRINAYHTIIPATVNLISVLLIYLAFIRYVKKPAQPVSSTNVLYHFAGRQWYFNEVYAVLFVKPLVSLSKFSYFFDSMIIDGIVNGFARTGILLSAIAAWADRHIVDRLVNTTGYLATRVGNFTRSFQTGKLQHYLLTMLFVVLSFFIIKYFVLTV